MDLIGVHLQYSNDEVEFDILVPWKTDWSQDSKIIDEVLDYMYVNFGLVPMLCTDSWVVWD